MTAPTSSGGSDLPSFEDRRRDAYRLLGDAQDVLGSDWRDSRLTREQSDGLRDARKAIGHAKEALNRAASSSDDQLHDLQAELRHSTRRWVVRTDEPGKP